MQEGKGGGAEKGGSRAALAAATGGIGAAAVEKGGRSIRGGGSKGLHAVAAVEARLPWRQPSILDTFQLSRRQIPKI